MSVKKSYTKTGDAEQEEKLLLPLSHLQQSPVEQIKYKLILSFNKWLQIPPNKVRAVGEIVQMLQNVTLLESTYAKDDFEDNCVLKSPESIYGLGSTINASDYVLLASLERVLGLGHVEASHVYTEKIMEICRGKGMEIYWKNNFICPTEDEYMQMTMKTGGLILLAIELMQLFSDDKSDFTKLANILGLYFEIREDYCNLWIKQNSENKSYSEDLIDGKFSLPIVYAINKKPEDNEVLIILKQRTKNVDVKRYCISLLEVSGSYQYTKETLENLDKEARKEVEKLGGNPLLISLLDDLLDWKDDTHTMKTAAEE